MVHDEEGFVGINVTQIKHGSDQDYNNQRKRKRDSPEFELSMGSTIATGSTNTGSALIRSLSLPTLDVKNSSSSTPLLPPFGSSNTIGTISATLGIVDQNNTDTLLTAHGIPMDFIDPALQYIEPPPESMENVIATAANSSDPSSIASSEKTQQVGTDDKVFAIKRIVKRWGKNLFLLQWVEGSYW